MSAREDTSGLALVSIQDAAMVEEVKNLVERYWSRDSVPCQGARLTDLVAWGMVLDLFPEQNPYPTLQQVEHQRRMREIFGWNADPGRSGK